MKTLANCKPSEFLRQTNKIRKVVANWLDVTDILNIRKRKPVVTTEMTDEERKLAYAEQAKENLNAILDACLEQYPEETLKVLGYLCFVEPEDVDNHPISEYIKAFTEIMNDEAVAGFFFSLTKLAQTDTSSH